MIPFTPAICTKFFGLVVVLFISLGLVSSVVPDIARDIFQTLIVPAATGVAGFQVGKQLTTSPSRRQRLNFSLLTSLITFGVLLLLALNVIDFANTNAWRVVAIGSPIIFAVTTTCSYLGLNFGSKSQV